MTFVSFKIISYSVRELLKIAHAMVENLPHGTTVGLIPRTRVENDQ